MSQERVLTLLYDKTFPPRPATAKMGKGMFGKTAIPGENDSMREFNYYGQSAPEGGAADDPDNMNAEEVERLEKEI